MERKVDLPELAGAIMFKFHYVQMELIMLNTIINITITV